MSHLAVRRIESDRFGGHIRQRKAEKFSTTTLAFPTWRAYKTEKSRNIFANHTCFSEMAGIRDREKPNTFRRQGLFRMDSENQRA